MSDKLMQPTSEMINSINSLNMLRNNLLPIQDNQQSFQQQNTLGQYLATIQYLTKQQQQPNQFNQQNQNLNNLNNLDNLLIQQHQLRQQLINGQNSNGNSPLSTQSLPDPDSYVDVINNLQRQQMVNQQQIEQNIIKNQIIKDNNLIRNDKQELLSKTIGNQMHNQINQVNNLNQDKFINYQQLNILNNQQQIIQPHQPEKYTSSPLAQIAQMTVIDPKANNLKCLEINKKTELNKSNDLKQLKHHFHSNLSTTKQQLANKPIDKKENSLNKNEIRHNSSDQNNNSTTSNDSNKQITSVIGVDEQGKPFHNYIGLIAQAILKSKEKRLVLSEIYGYILENYPFYRTKSSGWRNSIRHNLSLNDCFVKGPKAANGKGHYWFIHPANRRDFEKGDFRRRRAQCKVRRHLGLRMLDSRLDDDDQDSEDEELKKQFFSQFNHLQQLNLQHNLHNFQNNLYHFNNLNLNNLNSPTSSLAASNLNCPPLSSNEEYLNYLAFLKRNWLNSLNPSFNNQNLEMKPNNNLAIQYPPDLHSSSLNSTSNSLNNHSIKKEENDIKQLEDAKRNKDEDEFDMVDIDVEAGTNQDGLKNKKMSEEDFEMIEIEQVNDQNKDKKDTFDDQSADRILMDLNLIKKMMKDCTSLNDPNLNLRSKQKFDVDSLLKSEDVKKDV